MQAPDTPVNAPGYAELHCLTAFTFHRGASQPEELVERAIELGLDALAITDECSVAGAVRAWRAARPHRFRVLYGSEFRLADGGHVLLLVRNRAGWGQLCALISLARSRATKGGYLAYREDLEGGVPDCLPLLLPEESQTADLAWFARYFAHRGGHLAVPLLSGPDDRTTCRKLQRLARQYGLTPVATGGVEMHRRARRPLHDVLTAVREGRPVAEVTDRLTPNGERHLKSPATVARRYPAALLERTREIARQCTFALDSLRYEYPEDLVPPDTRPADWLRSRCEAGAQRRYPGGIPESVRTSLERELAIIQELAYEHYFLTVEDIVRFARSRGILCQGRGSAANSVVCFCLGITEVDPAHQSVLFERFVSRARGEPPDIDVDFEHERREEVIQYIYQRYGRHRAALAATVIHYRPRSAVRDVGKALGLSEGSVETLAGNLQWWDRDGVEEAHLKAAGLDPDDPRIHQLRTLVQELLGFPRHLSQHVGGFVIARDAVTNLVPVEPAAMAGRTVIQWDKDDLEALGLLKIDVLALGILTVLRRTFELLQVRGDGPTALTAIPSQDVATYRMIQRADTLGVFQIESRAQMAMLPRMRPRCFYDLVIEISIVRPGPIQGDMVHPYLRRREGSESVSYPSEAVRNVLERTLGVPIFQEQAMELAVVAAGFTPDEADWLRRSMAAWRKKGGLGPIRQRLLEGMRARGYSDDYAERVYRQIEGFGEYGFPESHAASFALLVYASAYLKCHHPAAFACALLNSQPMGFYAPSQIVQDARDHGVTVRPVDVQHSAWACTLEPEASGEPALRLGLCRVRGLSGAGATRLCQAREHGAAFRSVADLARRAELGRRDLRALADADALHALSGSRRHAVWDVLGTHPEAPLAPAPEEPAPTLRDLPVHEDVVADYASTGLSLRAHPLTFVRTALQRQRYQTAEMLETRAHGQLVRAAGLVINRQRPASARGVFFLTLEDETGRINLIVHAATGEAQITPLLHAQLLGVVGRWEHRHGVGHVVAGRLIDETPTLSAALQGLNTPSRDFG